jgi:hypothetical protein
VEGGGEGASFAQLHSWVGGGLQGGLGGRGRGSALWRTQQASTLEYVMLGVCVSGGSLPPESSSLSMDLGRFPEVQAGVWSVLVVEHHRLAYCGARLRSVPEGHAKAILLLENAV